MRTVRSQGREFVKECEGDGAPGASRTPDLLVRSQLLYPLSYGRTLQKMQPEQDTGCRVVTANLLGKANLLRVAARVRVAAG